MVRPRLNLGANSMTSVQIQNVKLLLFVMSGEKKSSYRFILELIPTYHLQFVVGKAPLIFL